MAGRRPVPTALKVLRGNPGKRPLNKREPKPKTVGARMPAWLSKRGKTEWRRVAPELKRLGLLTVLDVALLAMYCEAVAEFLEAQAWLAKRGRTYVIRDKDGLVKYVQQFPQVSIARNAAERARKIAVEFGFTPASRSKVSTSSNESEDDGGFW